MVCLHLHKALKTLGKRVLYYDTDSIIYVEHAGEHDLLTPSRYLEEFTSKLGFDQHITEFCLGGPQNYGYACNDGKTSC